MDRQTVSDWKSEVQRRRDILLNYLLLAAAILGPVAIIVAYLGGMVERGANPLERLDDLWPYIVGWLIVLVTWRWRSLGRNIRAGVLLLLAYLLGFFLLSFEGLVGSGRIWLVILPALAFVLLGQWPGFAVGGVSILTYVVFAVLAQDTELAWLWITEGGDILISVVGLALILWSFNQGWVDALNQASVSNEQLQAQTDKLEETTRQLRATAAVAHACSSILDPEALVAEVVNQIQKEFRGLGVYYVGLFLLDETEEDVGGRSAVLRAASGSVGQQLLDRGYRVSLDGTSAVVQCIAQQQPIVSGAGEEELSGGMLLEGARSGVALPLCSRGRVLGALGVQSAQEDIFDREIVDVLEAMADQVAVALDNAHLFAQTGAALQEVQTAQRRYLGQAWKEFLSVSPVTYVDYVQPGVTLEPGNDNLLRDARRAAMLHERSVATDSAPVDASGELASPQTVLAVPLKLREQVIGTLSLHETRRRRPWTSEETALAETIAEQVALTIENLRLMDEAQRRATRERLVGEVTARVRESLDMNTILRIAANEIGSTLGLAAVDVRLSMGSESDNGHED